jgi:hypothetical protein
MLLKKDSQEAIVLLFDNDADETMSIEIPMEILVDDRKGNGDQGGCFVCKMTSGEEGLRCCEGHAPVDLETPAQRHLSL